VILQVERDLQERLAELSRQTTAPLTFGEVLDRAERSWALRSDPVAGGGRRAGGERDDIPQITFEDLPSINDHGIQALLREIDDESLCLALQAASETLREKLFRNMPAWVAAALQSNMQSIGPVHLGDVEGARQRMLRIIQRLHADGEIDIEGSRTDRADK
jgi:hypothetical protein